MTFTLITGLPNSGKTTFAEQFENVIHLDDYYTLPSRANEVVKIQNGNCVLEGVYLRRKDRLDLLKCCSKFDRKICIFLDTPVEECLKRENRGRGYLSGTANRQLEPPTLDEGWMR